MRTQQGGWAKDQADAVKTGKGVAGEVKQAGVVQLCKDLSRVTSCPWINTALWKREATSVPS